MAIEIEYDLEPNELDLCEKLLPEFYNPRTVGPRFKDLNWEEEFKKDMVLKHGFVVRTTPFKKKIKDKNGAILSRGIKEKYGIHSPLFGTDYQDENAFAERYSCECGNLMGRIFEGRTCPKCGTKVKFVDVNLKMFAWLKIHSCDKFKIIHPLMYRKISTFLGSKSKILENIIKFNMDMSIDGLYRKLDKSAYKKNPFYGIGMVAFYERFDEIMGFFFKKHKNKEEAYKQIMQNKDKVFSDCIPVYSSALRQVFFSDEDYKYTPLDKFYNAIFGNFKRLNEETEVNTMNIAKINTNLYRAQERINKCFDMIFTSITEKEGLIRRNILGGRINNSARTVITPNAKLRSNEIEIPYVCAAELFKEEIINLLVKIDGESFNDAVSAWYEGFIDFSPKIYKIIQYIIQYGKPKILLNRNPTINFGSFLCMNIAAVKKDYEDLSAGLPIACLSSLNADFDGDTLNIVNLISKEFKKEFSEVLSPRTGFLLSRNDGKLNEDFALLKDQIIALHDFCEI